MSEGQDGVFDIDAMLDSIEGEDGVYEPSSSVTTSHFYHAKDVLADLKKTANYPFVGPCKLDLRQRWGLRMNLVKVFAKYQYESYLMDPYLEEMVSILIKPIRKVVHDTTVGELKGQPMNEHGMEAFYMLYFISKTRGYKTIVKFLPHEVADIEPAFEFLRNQDTAKGPWETRYVLLVWLSLMCMIPFDLRSIDSNASKDNDRLPLVDQMIEIGKSFLDRAGKDRDASSLFLARLMTRKDCCGLYLPEFVEWSKTIMASNPNIFQAIGTLGTLCWVFKLGQREVLLPITEGLEELLVEVEGRELLMSNSTMKKLVVKLSQRMGLCLLKLRVASWRYQRGNRSLASNLSAEGAETIQADKISTAIAEQTEEDENFDVPETIENVIERMMNGMRDRDTIVRWSAAKGIGRICNRLPKDMADDVVGSIFELFSEDVFPLPNGEPDVSSVSEHTWHGACLAVAELSRRGLLLPHRLTELIPWIILALRFDIKRGAHSVGSNVRDSACYVCWSFARAYTPEVLDAHVRKLSNTLIAVSVFDRDVNIRRASSAAFQENVGRMGIFPHGIDIVTVADYFSLGNMGNSYLKVAPYIAKFDEYRRYLTQHLLEYVIPHWDIAVREVASESMAIIAVLDLDYTCSDIIPALTKMTSSLDPGTRHGALIALGRTCKAVKEHSEQPVDQRISAETLEGIAKVVPSTPEFMLTGFGSEHIRQALCVHIGCLAESGWPADASVITSWKNTVYSTLERVEEPLQKLASETFRDLFAQHGHNLMAEFDVCLGKVASTAASDRLGTRGFALALGEIDYRKPNYQAWTPRSIEVLAKMVKHYKNSSEGGPNAHVADAEARRNAANAVTNIIRVLDTQYQQVISRELSKNILDMYFAGLQDYSVDHRGDIGSWIREASMQGLEVMIPLVARLDYVALKAGQPGYERYLSEQEHAQILSELLQQSVEKIDRIRACAAAVLVTILYARVDPTVKEEDDKTPEYVLNPPNVDLVRKVIPKSDEMNWLQASEVYPRLVELLHLPEYRTDLILGFIVSAGGLTETLVRHSSSCLIEFVSNLPITKDDIPASKKGDGPTLTLVEFGDEIMKIVERYEGQDRVMVPLLEVLDMLFECGCLIMMEGHYDFAPMVRFVKRQTLKCKDTRKLAACIRTYCGLCPLGGKIRIAILQELLRLLVHPFPKIRRTTADAMYLMMSGSAEDPTPESEQVGEILVNTDWNKAVVQLTPIRDQLYPLLQLEKPKPTAAAK